MLAIFAAAAAKSAQSRHHFLVPASFYPKALCVHDGWHYRRVWKPWQIRHATYRFGAYGFVRTWKTWSNGEAAWDEHSSSYGGGLQFMLSTWHRAGGAAYTTWQIASASPREQIYRMYRIVRQDNGSFGEWPNTSRACGL